MYLTNNEIQQTLNINQVTPSKTKGQNFLTNADTIDRIISHLNPLQDETILEIGPGLGAVTLPLAAKVTQLVAVEIDSNLARILKERIHQSSLSNKIEIVSDDFLNLPLNKLPTGKFKVFSSLPYSQASPILHKLINVFQSKWSVGVFILQKEVADNILCKPPHSNYWSDYVQFFYQVDLMIKRIPPAHFWPQPRVDSALIKLTSKSTTPDMIPEKWSNFLHRAFQHPRKQLGSYFDKQILSLSGINPQKRSHELTLDQLHQIYITNDRATLKL